MRRLGQPYGQWLEIKHLGLIDIPNFFSDNIGPLSVWVGRGDSAILCYKVDAGGLIKNLYYDDS